MLVRNKAGGASAPGGYYWENPGDILEVPNDLGNDLVRIGHDFEEVLPHEVDHESNEDWQSVEIDEGMYVERGVEYEGVPDGTANQVMDWVGEDPERAAEALVAEQAKGDSARSSLIAKLERLTS